MKMVCMTLLCCVCLSNHTLTISCRIFSYETRNNKKYLFLICKILECVCRDVNEALINKMK